MAEEEATDPDLICSLLRDVVSRGFDSEEFRGSCAGAVARLAQREFLVPDDVVGILVDWLRSPARPDQDESDDDAGKDVADGNEEALAAEDADERERSILWDSAGMVMLPHGNYPILDALMTIYLDRGDPDGLIDLLEEQLARDDPTAIWQPLVYRLAQVRTEQPSRLATFVRALFARHPALAGTREAGFFLGHLHWSQPELVGELVLACKSARQPRLQQFFGELVALVALVQPDQHWATQEFDALLQPGVPSAALHGAAESAVHVWPEESARAGATRWLVAAMPLLDTRGWAIVFDLFRQLDKLHPGPSTTALLGAIAEHLPVTVEADPTFLVSALSSLLPHNADLVGRIASRLVEAQRSRFADLRTGHSAVVPDLVDLAITLHRAGEASRDAGTALFEQLMDLDQYFARQTFDEIDNRFRETVQPRRRRLPRRSQRRRTRRSTAQSGSA